MKKVLFLAITLVMAFTLVACGGNKNSTSDISQQEQQPTMPIESEHADVENENPPPNLRLQVSHKVNRMTKALRQVEKAAVILLITRRV
ncbi:hypothetical protein [Calderihabitans maritimus]|nr:hypothetical protein [Calderihabitans maritimus]